MAIPQENWPLVRKCVRGDEDAFSFLQHLNHVVNVWDDLVDGDIDGKHHRVTGAFESALVHIPRNRFYRTHFADLQPLVETAISGWLAANEFEIAADDESIARAHVLRFLAINVIVMCARLVGGQDWADQCAVELWRVYPQETLPEYMTEIRQ